MNGEQIMTVSAATIALTQLVKWAGAPPRFAPLIVLVVSALGCGVFWYSQANWQRAEFFAYFAGWVAVATSAAGVFGFARSTAESLTAGRRPTRNG